MVIFNVRWVPCQNGMARPQVAYRGDGLQVWRVAANILNKRSQTANKMRSSGLGVGSLAKNSLRKNKIAEKDQKKTRTWS
jgi:hypothetical protein